MKDKKIMYIIIALILIAIIAVVAILLINNKNQNNKETENKTNELNNEQKVEQKEDKENNGDNKNKEEDKVENNPIVTMKIKDYGTVKIELYPKIAPNTVANFISLVQEGYYDGLIFHRIIPGFMAQGGDKTGTGSGETEFTIPGEFSKNGFTNNLKHEKGVISMARRDYTKYGKAKEGYDSAFSQFFIMFEDTSSLDGLYAAFGKVIEGMEVIDSLAEIEIGSGDRPVNPPVIEKMTVDTFGIDYGEPERLEPFDINAYLNGR